MQKEVLEILIENGVITNKFDSVEGTGLQVIDLLSNVPDHAKNPVRTKFLEIRRDQKAVREFWGKLVGSFARSIKNLETV